MNGLKYAVMAAVLAAMVIFSASAALAQSTCAVPADLKVVLLEAQWKFDVKSGRLSGEGVVSNISESDVVAPGVAIGVFNSTGEGIGTVLQRSTDARLAPGKTTRIKFSIDLKEVPASVMFTPFEGMQST
ncbi:MAG: hypothetical protein Q7I97_03560 [Thermovirgaceae bacterium]|nr:hypothetical protein [Thermovirgaceae bacterium]